MAKTKAEEAATQTSMSIPRSELQSYAERQYVEVDIDTLEPTQFQRALYPSHQRQIASNFSGYLANDPLVVPVDLKHYKDPKTYRGQYAIVEGQHTAMVLKDAGVKTIRVRVATVPMKEAAGLFSKQVVKRLKGPEKFISTYYEGGPWPYGPGTNNKITGAVDTKRLFEVMNQNDFGVTGLSGNYLDQDGQIRPTGTQIGSLLEVEKVLDRADVLSLDPLDHLDHVLRVIQKIWPENENDIIREVNGRPQRIKGYRQKASGYLINAMSHLILSYPEFLDESGLFIEEVCMNLARYTPREITELGAMKGNQQARGHTVAVTLVRKSGINANGKIRKIPTPKGVEVTEEA